MQINAFAVRIVGVRGLEGESINNVVNHCSARRAKYRFLSAALDYLPSLRYTDLRCRNVGTPVSTERFLNTARYRGLPELRCGDRIRLKSKDDEGFVIGSNCSANFDVLFYKGQCEDCILNIHPAEIIVLTD